ncbi:MAG: hypothetical protein RMX68_020410 [Aulosira sp. ZfuVER01]|nr:hypothetical protein [Aulosira sp. ZfuVER01]MDZ8002488.1 hypothetical protein [Aulosira sp. DedVER01a]MDZ8050834.1 hypothetical protein [Aulosira sp. ZfuCHP01]
MCCLGVGVARRRHRLSNNGRQKRWLKMQAIAMPTLKLAISG